MFYPELKMGFRLVPPGGNANTSVLKLVQNPNVPPGTSLGPQEPSGQSGPVAWRSCSTPLKATLRFWVTNAGNAGFDATTPALGLTGKIDATADRKRGVLRVSAIHEDAPFTAAVTAAVRAEIDDLGGWLGLTVEL